MFNSARLLVFALAFASSAVASVMPRAADTTSSAGAAYFIIDDPVERVVALNIASDGTLGPSARVVNAGGVGVRANHVTPPGKPTVLFSPGPDPLFTQGSVRVNEKARILVTVVPGSNAVALFSIDAQDPTKLTPVGKPVNSGGEFPNAVVINSAGTVTCVLNGGAVNGVNCFDIHPIIGLTPKPNTRRLLNVNETTPPSGPLGSLSTIVFSPDETKLMTARKSPDLNTLAFVAVWEVARDGSLSANPVKSFTDGPRVPFTLFNIPGSNAYVSGDPTTGFLTFDFGNSTSLTATVSAFEIPNQILNCWVAYSSKSGNFYVVDPGTSIVNEVHYDAHLTPTLVKQYQQFPVNSNTLDSDVAIVNNHAFLYVLQPNATSVGVLSVDHPGAASHVQTFNVAPALKAAGVSSFDKLNFQGMATFIKN